jgi:hypothetical protein
VGRNESDFSAGQFDLQPIAGNADHIDMCSALDLAQHCAGRIWLLINRKAAREQETFLIGLMDGKADGVLEAAWAALGPGAEAGTFSARNRDHRDSGSNVVARPIAKSFCQVFSCASLVARRNSFLFGSLESVMSVLCGGLQISR